MDRDFLARCVRVSALGSCGAPLLEDEACVATWSRWVCMGPGGGGGASSVLFHKGNVWFGLVVRALGVGRFAAGSASISILVSAPFPWVLGLGSWVVSCPVYFSFFSLFETQMRGDERR